MNKSTEESRLTQIGESYIKKMNGKSKYGTRYALYRCTCGKEKEIRSSSVNNKHTRSCGCLNIETMTSHSFGTHRLYNTWYLMKNRCYNEKYHRFNEYGGRGITVCERWLNVKNFIEDMNPTFEEGLSLDRINVNGNYEPKNCRWTNAKTQSMNTRKIRNNNTSGYRGVSLEKRNNKWKCAIGMNNKTKHLGYFLTALEGAKAYDTYVVTHNLEHTINGVLFSELLKKETE